jgi:hypothetical protein
MKGSNKNLYKKKSSLIILLFLAFLLILAVVTKYNSKFRTLDGFGHYKLSPKEITSMTTSQEITPMTPSQETVENTNPGDLLPSGLSQTETSTNLLTPGHIGQVSSPNTNANLTLRADPQIPKTNIGPWNNSTIEKNNFNNGF